MNKQDSQGARTVADLERKYNFGQTFAEVYGLVSDAQKAADNANKAVDSLDSTLNSAEIFNRLTNYGAMQGIYRENDEIYINAEYIKGGTIAAELVDTENLKVKAANITGRLTAEQIDATSLEVNAANIIGTITAGQIDATFLKVSAANITGTLTIGQLPSGVAKTGDIPTHTSDLTNDSGYQTRSGVTTIIDGYVTTDFIEALEITVQAANVSGTLKADQIKLGGEMNIYKSLTSSTEVGYFGYMSGSINGNSFTGAGLLAEDTAVLGSYDDDVLLLSPNDTGVFSGNNIDLHADNKVRIFSEYLIPAEDETTYCGSYSYWWANGYFSTLHVNGGEITTSDIRLKENVSYDISQYLAMFDNLKPCSYKFIKGVRTHLGMIAQEVEEAAVNAGLDLEHTAAICINEESQMYGLRYEEFVPILIAKVQQLDAKIKEMEANG